jgi:superoxide dismutase, Fe-Mn family
VNATLRREDLPSAQGGAAPIRRYAPKAFELTAFGKLSPASITTHLDLYQGYVVQTNALLERIATLDQASEGTEEAARPAEALSRRLSFELSGVILHELFFSQYLACAAAATGAFELAACHNFGSVEQWKAAVRRLGRTRGPGWVVTLFDPQQEFLHNLWVGSHDLHVPVGLRPIFALDLWEHAWLADYGIKGRDDYVEGALLAVSIPCLDARLDPQ